jgi:hypothetical protein
MGVGATSSYSNGAHSRIGTHTSGNTVVVVDVVVVDVDVVVVDVDVVVVVEIVDVVVVVVAVGKVVVEAAVVGAVIALVLADVVTTSNTGTLPTNRLPLDAACSKAPTCDCSARMTSTRTLPGEKTMENTADGGMES